MVLECLVQTLINYMELPYNQATVTLEKFMNNTRFQSDHEKKLLEKLEKLISDLPSPILYEYENPKFEKIQERLTKIFQQKPKPINLCNNPVVKMNYMVYCTCDAEWGVLGKWPSGKSFPILKCKRFNFYANGFQHKFKQWQQYHHNFKMSPLSKWFAQMDSSNME